MPTIIRFTHKGDFSKTTKFLKRAKSIVKMSDLEKYAKKRCRSIGVSDAG
jgi:hypothetical protein